jgi:hypothetical protein
MLRIKVCMNIIFICLRYLCTFSYSKNNSKFTGSLPKIYVCDVNKTLLSMNVKYVYGMQNRKYTGGAVKEKKAWNTVRVISYQFYLYINVISVLCNPNGTLFQTCLILHVWLKSIILVFANILNTFFSFFPIVFISKHALHNWFYTLIENWCRNTQSVRNKVIHTNYVFFVTSRSRTFRLGRNKELVCKQLLFLSDTREKCFLRYREPATPGYFIAYCCIDTPRHEQYSSSQF